MAGGVAFVDITYHFFMTKTKSAPSAMRQSPSEADSAQMISNTTSPLAPKAKVFQVLVRLPEDVASRFVQLVKPGQRNNYFLELLRRDLDRESDALVQAAQQLIALESKNAALKREDAAWLNASLINSGDDDFDAAEFERQYQVAKQAQETAKETKRTAPKARRVAPRTRQSSPAD
jgi:hypothetical protein